MKGILIGILAAFFFSFTFIFNRSMELTGGSWLWSASLRFLFMIPFFLLIVFFRNNLKELFLEMKQNLGAWVLWSFVGFVLFYAPITFAAAYGPSWLTAGTWQFTIISGLLLTPLFSTMVQTDNGLRKVRNTIPKKALIISSIIFIGILFIQSTQFQHSNLHVFLLGFLPVIISTFAYPLGNRKMMELCDGRLDTFQRILGMTIASTPFWILMAGYGLVTVGPPSVIQVQQTLLVAICSGVIATSLFFYATELTRHSPEKLGAVEATQSTQIVFVMLGDVLWLASPLPNSIALVGVFIIMLGILSHSLLSNIPYQKFKKAV
ncbi:multidrug resistance efflux transporter family protein [Alkalihalobacterium alkalinitrilicum]|uniref:DMT family transporter n=1 Tax=Alkalihalobacterium alkalinitrilicum TaxID=427920 RepID=UPI000995A1E8|nr:multidrug resistance efflux transporter family protein [Alkalihalobacterium alkalinitrilicum]